MSALSDLLNEANARNPRKLSARSVAKAAKAEGFTLNHDTAARYLRGDHGRPDEATLQALSKVLRVPLHRLRTAASLPAEVTEPYRPPAESSRLNRRQRRAIDEIIRAMLEGQPAGKPDELAPRRTRRTTTGDSTSNPGPPAKGSPRPSRAARRGTVEPPPRG